MTDLADITDSILPGLFLALLVGLTLLFLWSPVNKFIAHWRLHTLVSKLGIKSGKNFYLPDGLGDDIYIERLILQPKRILLVTIKPFRGNIFAAQQIEQWTQVVGHHSYKFQNPLHQQETDIQALRSLEPKITIDGLVVFAKGCRFPKGKPEHVMEYADLKQAGPGTDEIMPAVQEAWDRLMSKVTPAKEMRQSILYRREDKRRLLIGLLFTIATILYMLWYLESLPLIDKYIP